MTGSKFYAVFSFENLHLHNLLFFPIFVVVLKIRVHPDRIYKFRMYLDVFLAGPKCGTTDLRP